MDVTDIPLSEPFKSYDDSTLKSRAKRESRRKRELEQASFSLKLLKVRSSPLSSTENKVSSEAASLSLQSSLDSHESIEPPTTEDMELETTEISHNRSPNKQFTPTKVNKKTLPDTENTQPRQTEPSSPIQTKPLFYISDEASSPRHEPNTPSRKSSKDRKESLVFVISMQKESPTDQSNLEALERSEKEVECKPSSDKQKKVSSSRQPEQTCFNNPTIQPAPVPSPSIQMGSTAQGVISQARKDEAPKKAVTLSISMKEKATSLAFSPKRSRLTFSK